MSDQRINLGELRAIWERAPGGWRKDSVLALVEAVEAAHGFMSAESMTTFADLDKALARFDFSEKS